MKKLYKKVKCRDCNGFGNLDSWAGACLDCHKCIGQGYTFVRAVKDENKCDRHSRILIGKTKCVDC